MAETLKGSLAYTVSTVFGTLELGITNNLVAESHTRSFKRTVVIPALTTDFQIAFSDFTNVVLFAMNTNAAITWRTVTTNTSMPCERFMVETPNMTFTNLYITTGTSITTVELFMVGD